MAAITPAEPERAPYGTCLVALLRASYLDLTQAFGPPNSHLHDDKTTVQWLLDHDGALLYVYDYRSPASQGRRKHEWHVGAVPGPAVPAAVEALGELLRAPVQVEPRAHITEDFDDEPF